jgi:hypothetical protein
LQTLISQNSPSMFAKGCKSLDSSCKARDGSGRTGCSPFSGNVMDPSKSAPQETGCGLMSAPCYQNNDRSADLLGLIRKREFWLSPR